MRQASGGKTETLIRGHDSKGRGGGEANVSIHKTWGKKDQGKGGGG